VIPSKFHPRLASGPLVLCAVLWGAGVVTGTWLLWNHALTPGFAAVPPAAWPAASQLPRPAGRAMLVMFAHPRCPCTRASLRELERLLAHGAGTIDAAIAFVLPPGMDAAWAHTDSWTAAAAIPGLQVVLDRDGTEADRFHATTSGEVLLYDAAGQLAFQGGITAARSHEGDNSGRSAILALAAGQTAPQQLPTFGCPLRSSFTTALHE